jgi:hypothetical protein
MEASVMSVARPGTAQVGGVADHDRIVKGSAQIPGRVRPYRERGHDD